MSDPQPGLLALLRIPITMPTQCTCGWPIRTSYGYIAVAMDSRSTIVGCSQCGEDWAETKPETIQPAEANP